MTPEEARKKLKEMYADHDGETMRLLGDMAETAEKLRPFFTALVSEDEATAKAAIDAAKEVFGEDP